VLQVVEDLEHHVDETRLETDRRLVDQQDRRLHDQRPRDLQQPPFATGEDTGAAVTTFGEARVAVEDLCRGLFRRADGLLQVTAHHQVFLNGHVGKDRVVLQDVGDTGTLELVVRAQPGDLLAVAVYRAPGDPGEAVDRVQYGGLAGPVGPDQAQRLPASDQQVDAVQDLHLAVAGHQAVDGQQRIRASQLRQQFTRWPLLGESLGVAGDLVHRQHDIDLAETVAVGAVPWLGHVSVPRGRRR